MEKAEAEFQKRGARELREILSLARPFARARDAHFLNMLNAIAERVAKDGQAVSTSTLKAEHQATGEIKEFEGAVRCLRRLVWQIWNVGWLKELPNWQPRRADGGGRSRPCHYQFERADILYWTAAGELVAPGMTVRKQLATRPDENTQLSIELSGGEVGARHLSPMRTDPLPNDAQTGQPQPVQRLSLNEDDGAMPQKGFKGKKAQAQSCARIHGGAAAHIRSRAKHRRRAPPAQPQTKTQFAPASNASADSNPSARKCSSKLLGQRMRELDSSKHGLWTVLLAEVLMRDDRPRTIGLALMSVLMMACGALTVSAVRLADRPLDLPVVHVDGPDTAPYRILFVGREHVLLAAQH